MIIQNDNSIGSLLTDSQSPGKIESVKIRVTNGIIEASARLPESDLVFSQKDRDNLDSINVNP